MPKGQSKARPRQGSIEEAEEVLLLEEAQREEEQGREAPCSHGVGVAPHHEG